MCRTLMLMALSVFLSGCADADCFDNDDPAIVRTTRVKGDRMYYTIRTSTTHHHYWLLFCEEYTSVDDKTLIYQRQPDGSWKYLSTVYNHTDND